TLFTDGTGVGCHEDECNQRCSVCKLDPDHRPQDIRMASIPRNRGTEAEASSSISRTDHPQSFSQAARQAKELRAGREMGTLGRAQQIEKALQTVMGTCCICLVLGDMEGSSRAQHDLMSCPKLGSFLVYKEWRQKLRYRKHHNMICFICHVPQLSDSLHPTFTRAQRGRNVGCKYADIIAPTAFAIFHHSLVKRRAEAYFEVEWAGVGAFADWLMDAPKGKSESNLMDLFMWYMEMECM
ncbi:hypothetical protein PISMIDRAFT_622127, partial [Pisolithus microcarpus 441]